MIPLRDTIPSCRFPYVTILLIIVNGLIFLFEMSLGKMLREFIQIFGLIPDQYFSQMAGDGFSVVKLYLPFLTSLFLHGGWFHVLWNMWFLWIFGDNVEDRFGHFNFFMFYLFCGVVAGLAHVYMNPASSVPTVGASGAIAGVMGAYIILYPQARVLTIIPIIFIFPILHIPAYVFLGIWFVMQFLSGFFSLSLSGNYGGVAWWAHIGGFLIGMVTIFVFGRRRANYR